MTTACACFFRILPPYLLLLLLAAISCSRADPFRAIERSIEAELPRRIGPADRYEVTVSRSGGSLVAGRIPWIEIRGRNVRAIAGLGLDELRVRLEGVRFNRSSRKVTAIEQGRFEAAISAASATQFVRQRSPGLRDVLVSFTPGAVRVRASPAVLGLGVPLEVEGRPVLRGDTAIAFDASRVALLRLGLPEFAVRRLEARINPLADLAALPFPVRLTEVRVERDRAVVAGSAMLSPSQLQSGKAKK